jgi:hypothetical protein
MFVFRVDIEQITSVTSPTTLLTVLEKIFFREPVDKKDKSGEDDEINVCFGECYFFLKFFFFLNCFIGSVSL